MKSKRLRAFDRRQLGESVGLIGIDEAGRGALCGPVVAAAVAVRGAFYEEEWCKRNASSINDSKLLSVVERERLYERLRWLESEGRIYIGVGQASEDEIADHNILGATQIAMRRAVDEVLQKSEILAHAPDPLFQELDPSQAESILDWKVLVDGKPLKSLGYVHTALVKGDSRSLVIAMASIIAKVTRDRMMMVLDCQYPEYDFASSKGYATAKHQKAIREKGPTPVHRALFIRKILEDKPVDSQETFGFVEDR